jgi:hypothetical protein
MTNEKRPVHVIVDCSTGERTERPFTDEEMANYEADIASIETRVAEKEAEAQAKEEAKASALAKLAKLGLTEDEVKAIVG